MVDARRTQLPQYLPLTVSNAGLELNRYVKQIQVGGDQEDRRQLFKRLANADPPSIYGKAYKRWEKLLTQDANTRMAVAHAHSGLLVGLGAESVLETALTLHHIYGTPLIPGSALKGLARHYFEQIAGTIRPDRPAYMTQLFGRADAAGYVTYYDAWYVPGTAGNRPLKPDVLTPHHPRYNAGSNANRTAPTDFDDPNPVSFLQAQGGYLIAVRGPNVACADYALALVLQALADYGAGGKTSSGYGRLTPAPIRAAKTAPAAPATPTPTVDPVSQAAPKPAPTQATTSEAPAAPSPTPPPSAVPDGTESAAPTKDVAKPIDSALLRQIEALLPGQVYTQIESFGLQWARQPKGEERQAVARALYKQLQNAKLLNNFIFEDKQWVITLKREVHSGG